MHKRLGRLAVVSDVCFGTYHKNVVQTVHSHAAESTSALELKSATHEPAHTASSIGESVVSVISQQLTHCTLPSFARHELRLIQMEEDA